MLPMVWAMLVWTMRSTSSHKRPVPTRRKGQLESEHMQL